VYSYVSSFVDTGMVGAYAGVAPANIKQSIQLILKEIFKIKEMRVDASELHYAKEFTKGNLMLASESNDNQMVRMAQNETHFGRYVPLEEIINNIDAVTEDDILQLAEDLFQDNRFSVTILGPVDDKHLLDDILPV